MSPSPLPPFSSHTHTHSVLITLPTAFFLLDNSLFRLQKSVLKTSSVGPNSLFTLPKGRVGCDLRCLKDQLLVSSSPLSLSLSLSCHVNARCWTSPFFRRRYRWNESRGKKSEVPTAVGEKEKPVLKTLYVVPYSSPSSRPKTPKNRLEALWT